MEAAHHRSRWRAVEAAQRRLARRATVALRWRQLNAAYGLGRALHLAAADDDEALVHLRWGRLREHAGLRRKI
jgi:hypothetical protein